MKAITTSSFLTIFLLFSFVGIKAEEPTTTIKDKPHLIILTPTRNDKPRTSVTTYIECHYTSESISFILPNDIQYLEVTISNGDVTEWQSVVSHQNPEISPLPNFVGEYTITCRTNLNQTFQGSLLF